MNMPGPPCEGCEVREDGGREDGGSWTADTPGKMEARGAGTAPTLTGGAV